jgi:hypothetical protein
MATFQCDQSSIYRCMLVKRMANSILVKMEWFAPMTFDNNEFLTPKESSRFRTGLGFRI